MSNEESGDLLKQRIGVIQTRLESELRLVMPNVAQLIEFIQENYKNPIEEKAATQVEENKLFSELQPLKNVFSALSGRYNGLDKTQKFVALTGFSSGAHIASDEQDGEILGLFRDAFASTKYKNVKQLPELVVCQSDVPFAKSFVLGDKKSVFVSSNLIQILRDNLESENQLKPISFERKIKAVLRHELSHINDLSAGKLGVLGASNLIPKKRRDAEYTADEYGALDGKEANAFVDALVQVTIRMKDLSGVMRFAGQEVVSEIKKHVPDGFSSKAMFAKVEKRFLYNNQTIIDSVMDGDCMHPSMANRLAKIGEMRADYDKGRTAPYR